MSNASLELCKELYRLSGWREAGMPFEHVSYKEQTGHHEDDAIPLYDLGYLLRKLPEHHIELTKSTYGTYEIIYYWGDDVSKNIQDYADTPENAACKLAIELFKLEVLKK